MRSTLNKNFIKPVVLTFTAILLLLVAISSVVYIIDPYQQFRGSDKYINNSRMEIPGISAHHDYNAVVLGSSMAMNHYPAQIDSVFSTKENPWHTMNFAVMGGCNDDYSIIVDRLFNDGKVKYIIFDFDYFSFANKGRAIKKYLYTYNYFDKLAYLLNYSTLQHCIKFITNPISEEEYNHFQSFSGHKYLYDDYSKSKNERFENKGFHFEFEVMKENFESFLPLQAENRPDIEWLVYFPPYSIFEFFKYRNSGHLEDILKFKRYAIEKLLKYPNVKIYDFQCEESWIMNYNEYMDVRHHSHKYNKSIITSIHDNLYSVTKDNYRQKIEHLDSLVMHSDPDVLMKSYNPN